MKKIIGGRGTGKTRELAAQAALNHGIIVCADPQRMREKLIVYNFPEVQAMSYNMFIYGPESEDTCTFYIDDIEALLTELAGAASVTGAVGGFTVCTGEE